MRIVASFVLALVVLLPACGGDDAPPEPCTDPAPATSVELSDFAFRPDCLSADSGATITLDNNVDAGSSGEADLANVDPGTYTVTCTFHPQMEATLTVG
jgi:plastocyanin